MFGTLGFSEVIIILVIVLIIFGAGRLPQIGEGVGKALKGFKKEVNDIPPPVEEQSPQAALPEPDPAAQPVAAQGAQAADAPAQPAPQPVTQQAYQPGPERTPGTLAAQVYGGFGPETVQPAPQPAADAGPAPAAPYQEQFEPVTMEQRAANSVPRPMAQYPPVPPSVATTQTGKRPEAIVNKKAVARVQAKRAEMQAKAAKPPAAPGSDDLQSLGEGLGGALRTFREATADVRNAVDPEMRTIQAELESAQKEVEQSIEAAKQPPAPKDPPPAT